MKICMIIAALALSMSALAAPSVCTYDFNKEGSTIGWTAFKTPKKVGVSAKFSDFVITTKNSASIQDMLAAASFEINSQSVVTGDKARDAKIMQFFFKKMLKGTKITGKVLKATQDSVDVELTMNGTTKNITMKSVYDDKAAKLTLNGSIDVLDFGMKDNLAAITKACYEKHEGVTWPNVDIELMAMVKKSCK